MLEIAVDMDGVICTGDDYPLAEPIHENINRVNKLSREGHRIVIWTARGNISGKDWTALTKWQLDKWGVSYDDVVMKPYFDYYIDDHAIGLGELCSKLGL